MNSETLLLSLQRQGESIVNFVEALDEETFKLTKETCSKLKEELNNPRKEDKFKDLDIFSYDWYTKHEPFVKWIDEITEKEFTVIDAQYLLNIRALRSMLLAFRDTQDSYRLHVRLGN